MSRSPKKLRTLIRTSLIVSSRETLNGIISYLAYIIAGLVLLGMAILPILAPQLKGSRELLLNFIFFLAFFDIITLQAKLTGTALIERGTLGFFPISGTRSTGLRFVTFLVDKRLLLYFVPALGTIASLIGRGSWISPVIVLSLYILLYLVASELLFAVFPLLRRLSNRFSPRTVSQIIMLPLMLVFFLPAIFHLKPLFMTWIPVVHEFLTGLQDAIGSNPAGALNQLGGLLVVVSALTVLLAGADWLVVKLNPGIAQGYRYSRTVRRVPSEGSLSRDADPPRKTLVQDDAPPAARPGKWRNVRLVFLDWKVRQKEERLLYVILVYPFIGGMLMDGLSHRWHQLASASVLPVFFVTQMLGIAFMENQFTQHGLRLKHVSVLPMKPEDFVRVKFFSVFLLVSLIDILMTVALGYRLNMGLYQQLRGAIYSLYLPLVLVAAVTTLLLSFHEIYRHTILSLFIVAVVEFIATAVYGLLVLPGLIVGLVFTAGLILIAYYFWIPSWGRKLSMELQTLLEESK